MVQAGRSRVSRRKTFSADYFISIVHKASAGTSESSNARQTTRHVLNCACTGSFVAVTTGISPFSNEVEAEGGVVGVILL